jgi:hypothetical protein
MHSFAITLLHYTTVIDRISYDLKKIKGNVNLFMIDDINDKLFKSTLILEHAKEFVIKFIENNQYTEIYLNDKLIHKLKGTRCINRIVANMNLLVLLD